jgi:hypothetical protein
VYAVWEFKLVDCFGTGQGTEIGSVDDQLDAAVLLYNLDG